MAKKQKRSVSSVRTAPPISTVAPNGGRPSYSPPTPRTTYTQEFHPDYSVVISDLKRIGLMAGSFVVILVVLSFFLH